MMCNVDFKGHCSKSIALGNSFAWEVKIKNKKNFFIWRGEDECCISCNTFWFCVGSQSARNIVYL
jgi:hypothetical protein